MGRERRGGWGVYAERVREECGESESCEREIVVHESVCVYTWDRVSHVCGKFVCVCVCERE